jgi:hypothetical protein
MSSYIKHLKYRNRNIYNIPCSVFSIQNVLLSDMFYSSLTEFSLGNKGTSIHKGIFWGLGNDFNEYFSSYIWKIIYISKVHLK